MGSSRIFSCNFWFKNIGFSCFWVQDMGFFHYNIQFMHHWFHGRHSAWTIKERIIAYPPPPPKHNIKITSCPSHGRFDSHTRHGKGTTRNLNTE
ncbi:hypothetical protein MtrunA17_Chr2g0317351 [Medicago truncatula]|uniref:Uncharacterized protein n=1 Tax=Medicago truncatula TaxID=3880 RepID=A0A396JFF1_MEDTR|nr:hypothetical protein MtrunA17_Chr2g0317351 [Medicago truncatula]